MMTKKKLPLREAWIIWFVLGVVMLNYPFLHIFNKDILVFGVPLTIFYFFVGWPISILVIYFFSVYLGKLPENGATPDDDTTADLPPEEQP